MSESKIPKMTISNSINPSFLSQANIDNILNRNNNEVDIKVLEVNTLNKNNTSEEILLVDSDEQIVIENLRKIGIPEQKINEIIKKRRENIKKAKKEFDIKKRIAKNEISKIAYLKLYKPQEEVGYDKSFAWCSHFAWINAKEIADKLNIKLNVPNKDTMISTGMTMEYFRDNPDLNLYVKNNGEISYIPKPGDFIFFATEGGANNNNWNGFSFQNHTGMVLSYDSKTKTITTLEGNNEITIIDKKTNKPITCYGVDSKEYTIDDDTIIGFGSYY